MYRFLASIFILAILPIGCSAASPPFLMEIPEIGNITLLNMSDSKISKDCLAAEITKLVNLIDAGQVSQFKVMIFENHTLVKDILRDETIKIDFKGNKTIYLPIKQKGRRFIEKIGDDYRLLGIDNKENEINFAACITPSS